MHRPTMQITPLRKRLEGYWVRIQICGRLNRLKVLAEPQQLGLLLLFRLVALIWYTEQGDIYKNPRFWRHNTADLGLFGAIKPLMEVSATRVKFCTLWYSLGGAEGGGWTDGGSTEDTTPELHVERGFYQQDINSVCNASPRLPLRSLKGTGSEIGATYQMLQNWELLYRNSCSSHQVQLCNLFSLTFILSEVLNKLSIRMWFCLQNVSKMQQLWGNDIRHIQHLHAYPCLLIWLRNF